MWYKEERHARYKILIAFVVYLILAMSSAFSRLNEGLDISIDTFLINSLIPTVLLAALAGVDLISAEREGGTLDFLLTRPLSRQQVYGIKIKTNLTWLIATFLGFSLVMFGLSFLPLSDNPYSLRGYAGLIAGQPPDYLSLLWDISGELVNIAFVVTLAIATLCYTAFVSLFARTIVETIVFSVLILLSIIVGGVTLNILVIHFDLFAYLPSWFYDSPAFFGSGSLILLGLAIALYLGGLRVFIRQQI